MNNRLWKTGKDELQRDRKGENEAQGKFFPLTAAQRYDPEAKELENGVFLGHVAALTFVGPHDWQKVRRTVVSKTGEA